VVTAVLGVLLIGSGAAEVIEKIGVDGDRTTAASMAVEV
jgi:hypothetical protein